MGLRGQPNGRVERTGQTLKNDDRRDQLGAPVVYIVPVDDG